MNKVNQEALDVMLAKGRTQNTWLDEPVHDETLKELFNNLRWGPTSMNCQPARILFLRTAEAKERLKPALLPGNVDKTLNAPVVAVIGYDLDFPEDLPRMFAHNKDAKKLYEGKDAFIEATAFRNSSLQGGYFILTARAMGLGTAPMSGFNNAVVNETFWPEGKVKSNFLCALGYADEGKAFPRGDRFAFDEVCTLL